MLVPAEIVTVPTVSFDGEWKVMCWLASRLRLYPLSTANSALPELFVTVRRFVVDWPAPALTLSVVAPVVAVPSYTTTEPPGVVEPMVAVQLGPRQDSPFAESAQLLNVVPVGASNSAAIASCTVAPDTRTFADSTHRPRGKRQVTSATAPEQAGGPVIARVASGERFVPGMRRTWARRSGPRPE